MLTAGSVSAASVSFSPSLDTTIYSESANSNAQGPLFAGRVNTGSVRRAMVAFDIMGSGIPAGSVINSVSLTFTQITAGASSTAGTFELRPLLKTWGEGTSSGSGQGAPATSGDATWNQNIYSSSAWTNPGGDFGATSASTTFGLSPGSITFASSTGLVRDVQGWLDTPGTNFGWLLKAANDGIVSAHQLGSGESALSARPNITINFTAVPEPGLSSLLALLCGGMARRRRSLNL